MYRHLQIFHFHFKALDGCGSIFGEPMRVAEQHSLLLQGAPRGEQAIRCLQQRAALSSLLSSRDLLSAVRTRLNQHPLNVTLFLT